MRSIDLKYGRTSVSFEYDEGCFQVLGETVSMHPLSDLEIGAKLDSPIGSEQLEDIVLPGQTVLFVVSDATRQTACGQIINLLVRRMIANGTAPHEMAIIFAGGIHRAVTPAEKEDVVTPFIASRIRMLDHDAQNPVKLFRVGETSGGITVELNWALSEFDHAVLIGGVAFHYFAGFTGGRKLICPGLASAKTISETHKLAFDRETLGRRHGVRTGILDGNAVHEAFVEAASFAKPSFCVSTIVNDNGEATDVFCGDWIDSHRAACDAYAVSHTVAIKEKRDLVVASCGGYPFDINMIQAHKALEAASKACSDGGTIILLAECPDGLGRADFLKWFEAENSAELAKMLCTGYEVNGQTAWSLLRIAERFSVHLLSSLNEKDSRKMRMRKRKIASLTEATPDGRGYIVPAASKIMINGA